MEDIPKNTQPQPEEHISDELKALVIARLFHIPNNVKISVGSEGEFSRQELIESVKEENRVGQELVRMQLEFLRALGQGIVLDDLTASTSN